MEEDEEEAEAEPKDVADAALAKAKKPGDCSADEYGATETSETVWLWCWPKDVEEEGRRG